MNINGKSTNEKKVHMTNGEYQEELSKIFYNIDDNKILKYFYTFVLEKLKRVQ